LTFITISDLKKNVRSHVHHLSTQHPLLPKRKHANSHWKQDNVEHYSPDGEVKMELAENLYMEGVEGMAITFSKLSCK